MKLALAVLLVHGSLFFQIQAVNAEISQLVQRHLAMSNPADDKLAPFRQQAAIIARKKEATADQLAEMHARVAAVDEELQVSQPPQYGGAFIVFHLPSPSRLERYTK